VLAVLLIAVMKPTSGEWAADFSEVVRGFFRAKAQPFSANDIGACGCRFPLGGVVVVNLPALWLRVKTLLSRGLDGSGAMRRYLLRGVVVDHRVNSVPFLCYRSFGFFSFFYL
jgi:hypothetical protein